MLDTTLAAAVGVAIVILLLLVRWRWRQGKPAVREDSTMECTPCDQGQLIHRLCPHHNVIQSFEVEQKDSLDEHLDVLTRKLAEKEGRLRLSKSKIRETQHEIENLQAIDQDVKMRYREVMESLRSDLLGNEKECKKLQEQIEWVSRRRAELREEVKKWKIIQPKDSATKELKSLHEEQIRKSLSRAQLRDEVAKILMQRKSKAERCQCQGSARHTKNNKQTFIEDIFQHDDSQGYKGVLSKNNDPQLDNLNATTHCKQKVPLNMSDKIPIIIKKDSRNVQAKNDQTQSMTKNACTQSIPLKRLITKSDYTEIIRLLEEINSHHTNEITTAQTTKKEPLNIPARIPIIIKKSSKSKIGNKENEIDQNYDKNDNITTQTIKKNALNASDRIPIIIKKVSKSKTCENKENERENEGKDQNYHTNDCLNTQCTEKEPLNMSDRNPIIITFEEKNR